MSIEYQDCAAEIKAMLDSTVRQWMTEGAIELTSQTQALSRVDTGQTKGTYDYMVDGDVAQVGSPLENAIWEELGTGEYAVNHNGRKGGWYIPIGNGTGQIMKSQAEKYHFPIFHGKKGQEYAFTRGKKPNAPLKKAYDIVEPKLIKRLAELLGSLSND